MNKLTQEDMNYIVAILEDHIINLQDVLQNPAEEGDSEQAQAEIDQIQSIINKMS